MTLKQYKKWLKTAPLSEVIAKGKEVLNTMNLHTIGLTNAR